MLLKAHEGFEERCFFGVDDKAVTGELNFYLEEKTNC